MVTNQLKVALAKADTNAATLAKKIPGLDKVTMSYITRGKVLPTREEMEAICKELDCKATDIYDEQELDLNVTRDRNPNAEIANPLKAPVRQRAEDQDGIIRCEPAEKAVLIKATEGLGYRNLTEWFREMYRMTLKQYAALKLDGKMLHELIPPLETQEAPATGKS